MIENHKEWTKKQLTTMLFQSFFGTIADNVIEIGWVLCFSLIANKSLVEIITTMFGLNDAFWIILSSTYYTTRTAITSRLPKLIVEKGEQIASKEFKNSIYLFYILLLPFSLFSFIYINKILITLGVEQQNLSLYSSYFRLSILSILFCAPWTVMIPGYLRLRGRTKEALFLDHLVAWSMIIGIFFTTHILHKGVLYAIIVNMITNSLPLFWFIIKKPIPNFWKNGIEFSSKSIKEYWKIVKWELVRRLSPRISGLVNSSFIMISNPIFLGIKYWVSNLGMFLEGWVDASAGLLNSHVSRNVGLKSEIPYKDNKYIFKISSLGILLSSILIYLIVYFGLNFLPESIYNELKNPIIYILFSLEIIFKNRYYMWLSISRSYRQDLNGIAQLIYSVPVIILLPFLIYILLKIYNLGILGIFLSGTIVSIIQTLFTEIWFNIKLKN